MLPHLTHLRFVCVTGIIGKLIFFIRGAAFGVMKPIEFIKKKKKKNSKWKVQMWGSHFLRIGEIPNLVMMNEDRSKVRKCRM